MVFIFSHLAVNSGITYSGGIQSKSLPPVDIDHIDYVSRKANVMGFSWDRRPSDIPMQTPLIWIQHISFMGGWYLTNIYHKLYCPPATHPLPLGTYTSCLSTYNTCHILSYTLSNWPIPKNNAFSAANILGISAAPIPLYLTSSPPPRKPKLISL